MTTETRFPVAPSELTRSLTTAPDLSIEDFKSAVDSSDKEKLKVYKKVLKRSNKKKAAANEYKLNKWNKHVKEFKAAHPELSFKQVLQQAKLTYSK
jgi:hypothetical protein